MNHPSEHADRQPPPPPPASQTRMPAAPPGYPGIDRGAAFRPQQPYPQQPVRQQPPQVHQPRPEAPHPWQPAPAQPPVRPQPQSRPEHAGSWLRRLAGTTVMIVLATVVLSLLAAAGTRGMLSGSYRPFEPAEVGFAVTAMLIGTAWGLPSASMRFKTLDINPGRRGHISYLIAVTVIIAAALTAASAFWPLFNDFPVSARFVDAWQPTAGRLAAVFLLCWTASLASLGAVIVLSHLMRVRTGIAMALGVPLFLLGLGAVVGLIFFLKNLPAADAPLIFTITGTAIPMLLVIDILIGVLTVSAHRSITAAEAALSDRRSGPPDPASPWATHRR